MFPNATNHIHYRPPSTSIILATSIAKGVPLPKGEKELLKTLSYTTLKPKVPTNPSYR